MPFSLSVRETDCKNHTYNARDDFKIEKNGSVRIPCGTRYEVCVSNDSEMHYSVKLGIDGKQMGTFINKPGAVFRYSRDHKTGAYLTFVSKHSKSGIEGMVGRGNDADGNVKRDEDCGLIEVECSEGVCEHDTDTYREAGRYQSKWQCDGPSDALQPSQESVGGTVLRGFGPIPLTRNVSGLINTTQPAVMQLRLILKLQEEDESYAIADRRVNSRTHHHSGCQCHSLSPKSEHCICWFAGALVATRTLPLH